jgi:hypothetical protein
MALVLHVGGVGKCVRLIWEWSVHDQESGDLHNQQSTKNTEMGAMTTSTITMETKGKAVAAEAR